MTRPSVKPGWRERVFRDGESAKNVLVATTCVVVVLLFSVASAANAWFR
jgi:hypothetical protein